MRLKQKTKGYLAEKLVRDKLNKHFYILPKGISTKGVDIIALNKYIAVLIEVKSFNGKYLKIKRNQVLNLLKEEKKIKQFLDLKTVKLIAIIKGKEFKYILIDEKFLNDLKNKDIKITQKDFENLNNFDYFVLIEELGKREEN